MIVIVPEWCVERGEKTMIREMGERREKKKYKKGRLMEWGEGEHRLYPSLPVLDTVAMA